MSTPTGSVARVGAATTRIMGVLNVTPDSFSDGGAYLELDAALTQARQMVADGASIIDVGGESTRPGADCVTPEEEQRRVLPVIEALAAEGITVSIDTVHATTARLAIAAGATIINDVSGGTADPDMYRVAAETGADLVLMHWRGIPDPGHARSRYTDVVEEVRAELAMLVDAALAAGVSRERLILDPGLGFDKTAEQGWQLLAGFDRLASLGLPLLIGVSRKRMLAETLGASRGVDATMRDRDIATAVVSAFSAREGAWAVRVHDVSATATALAVASAWAGASTPASFASCGTWAGASPHSSFASCGDLAGASTPGSFASCGDLVGGEPALTDIFAAVGRVSAAGEVVAVGEVAAGAGAGAGPDTRDLPGQGTRDRITLTGLEVFAHHGVFDFEREQGQRFVIDAEVSVDLRAAANGDDLAETVHYGELAGAILAAAASDPVDLIETLAERIARVALGFAGVTEARITVHKPNAPIDATFGDVSVTVVRTPARLS